MAVIDYLRMTRIYNGHVMGIILILSYLLTATMHDVTISFWKIVGMFIAGLCAHAWGCYNNDRHDLKIDKKAKYCKHKPLVSGKVDLCLAIILEWLFVILFLLVIAYWVGGCKWVGLYTIAALLMAGLYNKYNKSSMLINALGQLYIVPLVMLGMACAGIGWDWTIFIIALAFGANALFLNDIEADSKDIAGDDVNIPRALGVTKEGNTYVNTGRFLVLGMVLRAAVAVFIMVALLKMDMPAYIVFLAMLLSVLNYMCTSMFFVHLTPDREATKKWILLQEASAILLISIPFMAVQPFIPLIIPTFAVAWILGWCMLLWGKPMPQV